MMRDGNLHRVRVFFVGEKIFGRCLLDGTIANELSWSVTKIFSNISMLEAFLLTGDEGLSLIHISEPTRLV